MLDGSENNQADARMANIAMELQSDVSHSSASETLTLAHANGLHILPKLEVSMHA